MSLRNARSKQACFQGENRQPGITGCQGDLPKAGPIRLALLFTDKLGGSGWTEVIFDHFMGKVTVKNHMGLPE
jgi:hypothetical protein